MNIKPLDEYTSLKEQIQGLTDYWLQFDHVINRIKEYKLSLKNFTDEEHPVDYIEFEELAKDYSDITTRIIDATHYVCRKIKDTGLLEIDNFNEQIMKLTSDNLLQLNNQYASIEWQAIANVILKANEQSYKESYLVKTNIELNETIEKINELQEQKKLLEEEKTIVEKKIKEEKDLK